MMVATVSDWVCCVSVGWAFCVGALDVGGKIYSVVPVIRVGAGGATDGRIVRFSASWDDDLLREGGMLMGSMNILHPTCASYRPEGYATFIHPQILQMEVAQPAHYQGPQRRLTNYSGSHSHNAYIS